MNTSRFSRALAVVAVIVGMSYGHKAWAQQITQVSPDNGSLTVGANLTGRQAQFFVSSQSNQSTSRLLSIIQCSGQISSCSVPGGTGNFIQTIPITVTFTSLGGGTGTIVLRAEGSTSADQGSIIVTVTPAYGVAVTPDGGTEPTRAANTGGYTAAFTVQNTGSNGNTFNLTCSGTGGVTCGTVPGPLTFPANQPGSQQVVNMPYSVGAPGTGTLTLTATGTSGSVSDQGSMSVPIVSYGVVVTPDAQIAATRFSDTSGDSETFTVRNSGSTSNTYTFGCAATGVIVCGTVPSALTLNPGYQQPVNMPYAINAAGTGTLTLTAAGANASDQGSFSIPVAKRLSAVSQNGFTADSFIVDATADGYDTYGRPTQVTDGRGSVARYDYGSGNAGPFLTKLTRVQDGTNDLITEIFYDPSGYGYVSRIKDEGGTSRWFTYDGFGRLLQIRNNAQTAVLRGFAYDYSRKSGNGWTFQSASPNSVVDSTYIKQSPLQVVVNTGYVDGLGRPIQSVVRDGSDYHVTATQYDLMGRTWRVWTPYRRQTAGYDAAFITTAKDSAVLYHGIANAQPYVETQYRPDPLGRVSRVIPQYFGTTPAVWKTTSYGIDPTNLRTVVEQADELGKKTQDSTDAFGNVVRRVLGYGSINAITAFTYDVVGRRTQAIDPRGLATNYGIDTRGLQRSRTSPDAGTINAKYDKAGNVRFTQDAVQAASGKVYFTNYDFAGRPLVSGVGAANFASLDADAAPTALETDTANWRVVRKYDAKPTNLPPWNWFWTQILPLTLNGVNGRLAAVASKSGTAQQVTLFSYDADGQVVTRYTYTQANGGGSVWTALNTTGTYTRDLRGALTQRSLTVGSNNFYHWYDYNNRGLLWKTFAATTPTKPATADAIDTYRPSGLPKDYQMFGGPLVPIRYTIRGQTEKIGDPSLTTSTYPFSARYVYLANGLVDTAEFRNLGSPAAQKRYRYAFDQGAYDPINRLQSANFSSWSGSAWTSTLAHDLAGISYDLSGNIIGLQRYRETATLIDNLTYTISPTSNRLTQLQDAIDGSTEVWDAEDAATADITYDANGNLTKWAVSPYLIAAISYNHQNLPTSIVTSSATSTYRYDDAGQRITKQVGTGNTEVYIREGPTTLGVFTVNGTGSPQSWHFNVLWEDRVIGRQPNTGTRRHYHFDHLGSTRAVVQSATIVESYDFEPWGLRMPGRTLAGPTKEGFTSKEQDAETGLEYFGARYYMPATGRWAAVDPHADSTPEWTPYAYALDDPIQQTDPDGRQVVRSDMTAAAGLRDDMILRTMIVGQWLRTMEAVSRTTSFVGDVKTGPVVTTFEQTGTDPIESQEQLALVPGLGATAGMRLNVREPVPGEEPFNISVGLRPYVSLGLDNKGPSLNIGSGWPELPIDVSGFDLNSRGQPSLHELAATPIKQEADGARVNVPNPPKPPPSMRACTPSNDLGGCF